MGHWNYRVMEFESPDGERWRTIHEVHYDDDGNLNSYAEDAAPVMANLDDVYLHGKQQRGGIEWTLDRMREALDRPVLTPADFDTEEPLKR